MTDFKPFTDKIWETARDGDKPEFDRACDALMEKTKYEIWRIGWEIYPKDIDELYTMLDNAAQECHSRWLKAMEVGDAPPEDVSPGEGFARIKMLIQQAIKNAGKGK